MSDLEFYDSIIRFIAADIWTRNGGDPRFNGASRIEDILQWRERLMRQAKQDDPRPATK